MADPRNEMMQRLTMLCDLFGAERGVELCEAFEEPEAALIDEVERLQRMVSVRDSQLNELNETIRTMQAELNRE